MKVSKKSIASLVKSCREGNRADWNELIFRITPLIFSICTKMGLSREESFDIFGQVSYLLLKNLNILKSTNKVLSYIITMTKREIYAFGRKEKLRRCLEKTLASEKSNVYSRTPEEEYYLSSRSETLLKALAKLPARDSRFIQMMFFAPEKYNYEEISKKVNMPVSSIGPYRARCLVKLLKILKEKI